VSEGGEATVEGAAEREATPGVGELSLEHMLGASIAAMVLSVGAIAEYGFDGRSLVSVVFLVAICFCAALDLQYRLIPNRIVLPAAALVLVLQIAFFSDRTLEWIGAAAGAGLLFLLPSVLRAGSVGMGDVKLAFLIGAALGRDVIAALVFGSLAAAAYAVVLLVRQGAEARKETMPLGPFLTFGAVIALFISSNL
jgi:prepilin signal peptidase PulO-like enzyme (type II secretory pathway)